MVVYSVGADTYLTKPFSIKVLIKLIHNLHRRRDEAERIDDDIITCHRITLDRRRHRAMIDDQLLELTRSEFRLLETLMRQPVARSIAANSSMPLWAKTPWCWNAPSTCTSAPPQEARRPARHDRNRPRRRLSVQRVTQGCHVPRPYPSFPRSFLPRSQAPAWNALPRRLRLPPALCLVRGRRSLLCSAFPGRSLGTSQNGAW